MTTPAPEAPGWALYTAQIYFRTFVAVCPFALLIDMLSGRMRLGGNGHPDFPFVTGNSGPCNRNAAGTSTQAVYRFKV
jgi:hypothetical protein